MRALNNKFLVQPIHHKAILVGSRMLHDFLQQKLLRLVPPKTKRIKEIQISPTKLELLYLMHRYIP